MNSNATTPEQYIAALPDDRRQFVSQLHDTIIRHLPAGFETIMNYGMIGYVVPHSLYPDGYHCDKKLPLPFAGLASQKASINFYHMGIYAKPDLLEWFVQEYPKHTSAKLDMGKSCIRFKKPEQIPHALIAELMQKMTVQQWIDTYESNYRRK